MSRHSNLPWLDERTIFLTRHGSHAYGTSVPTSDLDLKGVAIAPRAHYLGFTTVWEQAQSNDPDMVVYELRKFLRLAADANPSILEVLFTDPSDHLKVTALGEVLLAGRELFLSRKVKHTFCGFAIAQLKRIKAHRRWLVAPPDGAEPKEWQAYEQWKQARNPARAELEARHGYDTKHAMHVVRLLRMCREILSGQGVNVRRPDADELLAIRHGAWAYDDLVAWAEAADAEMQVLAASSPLPHAPPLPALDALCERLLVPGLGLSLSPA